MTVVPPTYVSSSLTSQFGAGDMEGVGARIGPEKQQHREEIMVAFNWQLAHGHSEHSDLSGWL